MSVVYDRDRGEGQPVKGSGKTANVFEISFGGDDKIFQN